MIPSIFFVHSNMHINVFDYSVMYSLDLSILVSVAIIILLFYCIKCLHSIVTSIENDNLLSTRVNYNIFLYIYWKVKHIIVNFYFGHNIVSCLSLLAYSINKISSLVIPSTDYYILSIFQIKHEVFFKINTFMDKYSEYLCVYK